MRITDSRYDRDRLRLALAHRLIELEARTRTIRIATQLSDDRIRRLYREYFSTPHGSIVRRHRGKSPQQMAYFRRSLELEQQAATLGTLVWRCELVFEFPDGFRPRLEHVAQFCNVYETFASIWPSPFSFEHAWHLWQVLCSRDEHVLAQCPGCQAIWLRDLLEILPDDCPACRRGLFLPG
jgi:hypothetical protein